MARFLIIARPDDAFAAAVDDALGARGHQALRRPQPFAAPLSVELPAPAATSWERVLMRAWPPGATPYLTEGLCAATPAWMATLDCPVVNRLDAPRWFRPTRPPALRRAGLLLPRMHLASAAERTVALMGRAPLADHFARNMKAAS